jgi:hypothetical protein
VSDTRNEFPSSSAFPLPPSPPPLWIVLIAPFRRRCNP